MAWPPDPNAKWVGLLFDEGGAALTLAAIDALTVGATVYVRQFGALVAQRVVKVNPLWIRPAGDGQAKPAAVASPK